MNQAAGAIDPVLLLVPPEDMPNKPRLRNMCGTPFDDPNVENGMYSVRFISEPD
jgi:hypothetical protein